MFNYLITPLTDLNSSSFPPLMATQASMFVLVQRSAHLVALQYRGGRFELVISYFVTVLNLQNDGGLPKTPLPDSELSIPQFSASNMSPQALLQKIISYFVTVLNLRDDSASWKTPLLTDLEISISQEKTSYFPRSPLENSLLLPSDSSSSPDLNPSPLSSRKNSVVVSLLYGLKGSANSGGDLPGSNDCHNRRCYGVCFFGGRCKFSAIKNVDSSFNVAEDHSLLSCSSEPPRRATLKTPLLKDLKILIPRISRFCEDQTKILIPQFAVINDVDSSFYVHSLHSDTPDPHRFDGLFANVASLMNIVLLQALPPSSNG